MDNEQTVEAVKQITWAGYALLHAPEFGSGGFILGVLLFLWRWSRNLKAFCCGAFGGIVFVASMAYLYKSNPNVQHE